NHIYVEDERLYSDEEEMDGAPDTRQTMFSQIFKNNEFMFWDSDYYYVQEVSMNSMLPDYQPQTLMELENCTQIPEGLETICCNGLASAVRTPDLLKELPGANDPHDPDYDDDHEGPRPSWWNQMTNEQCKDFLDRELEEMNSTHTEGRPVRYVRKTDSDRPKRPMSSWNLFVSEMSSIFPNKNYSEFSKWWNEMNQVQRKKYEDMAARDRLRWQSEVQQEVPNPPTNANVSERAGIPKPRNPNQIFRNEMRKEIVKQQTFKTPHEKENTIQKMWLNLSEDQRQEWKDKATSDVFRYELEKAAYEMYISHGGQPTSWNKLPEETRRNMVSCVTHGC
ncbi:HMG-box domain-containing protein, partial [Pirellulaceae bacterium]|nr:HMG-box domain-containing protein [Pirellulaceae bacterium]